MRLDLSSYLNIVTSARHCALVVQVSRSAEEEIGKGLTTRSAVTTHMIRSAIFREKQDQWGSGDIFLPSMINYHFTFYFQAVLLPSHTPQIQHLEGSAGHGAEVRPASARWYSFHR